MSKKEFAKLYDTLIAIFIIMLIIAVVMAIVVIEKTDAPIKIHKPTTYSITQYSNDGKFIKKYENVVIINQTENYTTIFDEKNQQTIRLIEGKLDIKLD